MRLNEIRYDGKKPVDGYGPGFFRIGGAVHRGPVLILPSGVAAWGGYEDTTAILAEAAAIDVLIVGTGAETSHVPPEFRAAVESAGPGIEQMASPNACRTYNVLLSEGRRIALALIPV